MYDISLEEFRIPNRLHSHCSETIVQRSATVRNTISFDTINPESLLHDRAVCLDLHAEKQETILVRNLHIAHGNRPHWRLLIVQRRASVWIPRMKHDLAGDTIDPRSLLHVHVVLFGRHAEDRRSDTSMSLTFVKFSGDRNSHGGRQTRRSHYGAHEAGLRKGKTWMMHGLSKNGSESLASPSATSAPRSARRRTRQESSTILPYTYLHHVLRWAKYQRRIALQNASVLPHPY